MDFIKKLLGGNAKDERQLVREDREALRREQEKREIARRLEALQAQVDVLTRQG